MTLTAKQELFVHELIKGKSQREAYKTAYDTSNMSDAVIDVKASELMKNGKVSVRYEELHSRLLKEAEDECIVSAKEVLRELKHIAFDDIKNYLRFYSDEDGIIKMNVKDSDSIDTRSISEVSLGKDGQFRFKMYCKDNALVQLGRHLGMFNDKIEHSGAITHEHKHDLKKLSPKELADLETILSKTADSG